MEILNRGVKSFMRQFSGFEVRGMCLKEAKKPSWKPGDREFLGSSTLNARKDGGAGCMFYNASPGRDIRFVSVEFRDPTAGNEGEAAIPDRSAAVG